MFNGNRRHSVCLGTIEIDEAQNAVNTIANLQDPPFPKVEPIQLGNILSLANAHI